MVLPSIKTGFNDMTTPAERFKAKMQERDAKDKERLETIRKKVEAENDSQQRRIDLFLDELQNLLKLLNTWAQSSGLKTQQFSASYSDFGKTINTNGLMVSDERKRIIFYPSGVSRSHAFKGTVDIQLPSPQPYHQYYLALDANQKEDKPFWVLVDYNEQEPSNWQSYRLTEELFFQIMEQIFFQK